MSKKRAPVSLAPTTTDSRSSAAASSSRKPGVLSTMPTIRWLLACHGFQTGAYTDDMLAEALIETCPTASDFWLRSEHLNMAARSLAAAKPGVQQPRRGRQ